MDGSGRSWIVLRIDDTRCHVCGTCRAKSACKGKAIRVIDHGEAPYLDSTRCWGCLTCLSSCPFGAVVRYEMH